MLERKLRMMQIEAKAKKCRVTAAEKRRREARRKVEDIRLEKELSKYWDSFA